MATFISHSPAETESLGERFGRVASRGLVVALSGELGAGKTQFVKGVARGLGVSARVHSPTFTLVNEYDGGRLKLFHLDLYRLETPEQIMSAGIEEFLEPDGVAVIEWAERLGDGRSKMEDGKKAESGNSDKSRAGRKTETKWISVEIEILNDTERKITYDDFGA
jgi:tRNA threonylcarbamoyladenosine biosynthesis protein TsaE